MNIEVNKKAPAYAREEITVDAPAEVVFNLLADINRWPEWQRSVQFAKMDESPNIDVPFQWKAGGLNINSNIHTYTRPGALGWTGKTWWIKAVHNWKLIEENGKTKVIVEESLEGFLSGMMRNSLRKGMRQNLQELKIEAEKRT